MTAKITLPEPVVVGRFFRNRRKDVIQGALSTFKDINVFDIRLFAMTKDGRNVPTPKGLTMSVRRLHDLHEMVTKLLKTAQELGLLDGADDDDEAASS
jgi:Transcriptional Coactivator p15 (PC4)